MKEKYVMPLLFVTVALILNFCFYRSQPKAEETIQYESSTSEQQESTSYSQTSLPVENLATNPIPTAELIPNLTLVGSWEELKNALDDESVSYIRFKNDISDVPNSQTVTLGRTNNSKLRDLVIDGNGHRINMKNSYFTFNSETLPKTATYTITTINLDIFQGAFYGMLSAARINTANNNNNAGKLTFVYKDVNYTGAQMISSYHSDIEFRGHIKIELTPKYLYDGELYNASDQEALESANVTIADGTVLEASNNNYNLFKLNDRGKLTIGNNTSVKLYSSASLYPLITTESLKIESNSYVVMTQKSNNQTIIDMSASAQSHLNIGASSKLIVNVEGNIGNNAWVQTYPVINMGTKANSTISVSDSSNFDIHINGRLLRQACIVNMKGAGSQFLIDKNATFTVDEKDTSTNSSPSANLFDFGTNTYFGISENGKFSVNLPDILSSSNGLNFGSNSSLDIKKGATFDFKAALTGAGSYLLNFNSGGQIQVDSSELFNLEILTLKSDTSSAYLVRLPTTNRGILFKNQDILAVQNKKGASYASQEFGELNWFNIKKLYIPTSSPASTGLSGVTDNSTSHANTQVEANNDRVTSSLLCNFFLSNYQKLTLTSPSDIEENTIDVSTWSSLDAAIRNQSITKINIRNDIVNDETTSNTNRVIPKKGMLINGNGHKVDFRGISFYNNDVIAPNVTMGLEIIGLHMYGQNFYGPFKYSGSTSTRDTPRRQFGYGYLKYENVTYEGAQLTASYTYDIVFAGKVTNKSMSDQYTSPFDNQSYKTQGIPQVNIEATNVIFEENAIYNGSAEDAGVFRLASGGGITLGKNSNVTLTSLDNTGNSGEYDGFVLSLSGGVFCNQNSKLTINTRSKTPQSAIDISASSGSVVLDKYATLNINLDDRFNNNVSNAAKSKSIIDVAAMLKISEYATLNIRGNIERSGLGSTSSNSNGLIDLKQNGHLQVDQYGSLLVSLTGNVQNTSVIKSTSANSKVNFSSAKLIDIDISQLPDSDSKGKSLNNKIFQTISFETSYQKVSAWNIGKLGDASFIWDPVYSLKASHNNYNSRNVTSGSNKQTIVNSLNSNFKVENFNHIRFEGYPDLSISLNPLSNDQTLTNSYTLEGKTEPNALVFFSGDKAIPTATLTSYDVTDKSKKYHIKSDANGKFSYKLPQGKYFTVRNTITATAFSNTSGKTATATQKVVTSGELPKDSDYIKLVSASDIDFGHIEIDGKNRLLKTTTNQVINIEGLQELSDSWKLNLTISPFTTTDGDVLPSNYSFGELPIEPNSQVTVFEHPDISVQHYSVEFTPDNGLKLDVNLSQALAKKYSSTAKWSVVIGP
ncbi:pectate lyase-like adhesive domain-containing protein [Holzapfeliella sp. JNUCC 80]